MLVGDFATLTVTSVRDDGAFLDWGRPRPLFLPWREQRGRVFEGDEVVVYITTDRRQSPMASMKVRDFLKHDSSQLEQNQKVELLLFGESDMGFEAIIDDRHLGILYHNEVFANLEVGDRVTGYVKKIREDGKVDLMSQLRGTSGTPELAEIILDELQARGGFLPVNDKSAPEDIYDLFGVSKKKFKMALGGLYKARQITFEEDGIRAT